MKKCIVISDSFKGTLSSEEICETARESLLRFFPECEVITLPVADGGEGTVLCMTQACKGRTVLVKNICGPFGEPVDAAYGILEDKTAVVEMAAAAGLPMAGEKKDPRITTTYGVGELVRHAVRHGAKKVILGLGGSATNDGGCGCAAALGVRFKKKDGEEFVPVGGNLDQIAEIDISGADEFLKGIRITAMCDIDNPMYGKNGAAYIFGPQKGADEKMVEELDGKLRALDGAIIRSCGKYVAEIPGAGAAGAFGAGCIAFLHAELKSGIETVLDAVRFDDLLRGTDMVFTGEGRIDGQSLRGKVVSGVAARASKQNVPVIVLAGTALDDAYGIYDLGVTAVFTSNRQNLPFTEIKKRSRQDYRRAFEDILRLIRCLS